MLLLEIWFRECIVLHKCQPSIWLQSSKLGCEVWFAIHVHDKKSLFRNTFQYVTDCKIFQILLLQILLHIWCWTIFVINCLVTFFPLVWYRSSNDRKECNVFDQKYLLLCFFLFLFFFFLFFGGMGRVQNKLTFLFLFCFDLPVSNVAIDKPLKFKIQGGGGGTLS